MRTSTFISSSLLAVAVSAAPVELPKLPVADGLLQGVNVDGLVKGVNVGGLTQGVNVGGLTQGVKAPAVPVVGDATAALPSVVGGLNLPLKRDIKQTLPVVGGADVPLDAGKIQVGTVDKYISDLLKGTKVGRGIKQTLPVVGGADVPLDAGEIEVGTVDKYITDLLKGTKVNNLKVARDIDQTLPIVSGVKVPLDAGKLQVGNLDKDVLAVLNGLALGDKSVIAAVKGIKVANLPKVARDIDQTLPIVSGVKVPLDAGKLQVGTLDADVLAVVNGIALGDKSVINAVKGIKVANLPKVARDIDQTLPIVSGVKVPLDAGKLQVGTLDSDVLAVLNGLALGDKSVIAAVKGIKVANLPKVARDIDQTLPVVDGVKVPLDAGKIQVGTVDKYVVELLKGTKIGN